MTFGEDFASASADSGFFASRLPGPSPPPVVLNAFNFPEAAFGTELVLARGGDLTEIKNYSPDILPSLVSEN